MLLMMHVLSGQWLYHTWV